MHFGQQGIETNPKQVNFQLSHPIEIKGIRRKDFPVSNQSRDL